MLHRQLKQLASKGRAIRVALVGCGRMGRGVINQIAFVPGMTVVAVADQHREAAESAAHGDEHDRAKVCVTDDRETAADAIARGMRVATTSSHVICSLPVDVVVEATGIPDSGVRIAVEAIRQRMHVITMNVEADALVGPMLAYLAREAGVVYSVTAGDEPGVLGDMVDWARTIGLEVVAALKGCMKPIDWNANAQTLADEAARLKLNPKMLASFRDGSKHSVEVCVTANGTGLVPDVRGTHARALRWDEYPKVICPKKDGGILSRSGVVELAQPVLNADGTVDLEHSVTPGVGLIVTTPHAQIRADFKYLLQGDGPYYVMPRPFHLCAMELPQSVAKAYFHGDPTLNAIGAPVAAVICIAKRNLEPGDVLTGSGGAEVTGQIDRYAVCRSEHLLPLGLSYGVEVVRPVARGQAVTLDNVRLDRGGDACQLWLRQCEMFPAGEREPVALDSAP